MEEKKTCEELKNILRDIQNTIEMYNNISCTEKLSLTRQGEKKDVSDVFICVYDDGKVGLFRRSHSRSDYSIYFGISSDYIGMRKRSYDDPCESWVPAGTVARVEGERTRDNKFPISNCMIQYCISFDEMRLIMYNDNKICPYVLGRATSQEMIDVLNYAYNYYQTNKNIYQRTK